MYNTLQLSQYLYRYISVNRKIVWSQTVDQLPTTEEEFKWISCLLFAYNDVASCYQQSNWDQVWFILHALELRSLHYDKLRGSNANAGRMVQTWSKIKYGWFLKLKKFSVLILWATLAFMHYSQKFFFKSFLLIAQLLEWISSYT